MTSHGGIVVPDVMGAVSECQECQAPKPRALIDVTVLIAGGQTRDCLDST